MQKPTAQEILAKARRFLLSEDHLPRFDDVGVWEGEQLRIHDLNVIGVLINVLSRQTMDGTHQFAIGPRRVCRPAPALRWKEVSAAKLRTSIRPGIRHRESPEEAMQYWVLP